MIPTWGDSEMEKKEREERCEESAEEELMKKS
jgi:hypothetical protein